MAIKSKETVIEVTKRDHEAEFQKELLERHIYWKSQGKEEYATAYLLLLHNFTKPNQS
jgi:hypothetical protein